jgi:type II secretory pathway predicted ATPase ExeA
MMVLDYYNLREQPFGATPDAAFLFSSETHREALASLLYGIKSGRGFIALIATPGMGKTTLLFRTLSKMEGVSKTVFLFQSISTPLDLLRTLLHDLGVEDVPADLVELQAKLTEVLFEQSKRGERLVVVIDEAQNLDNSVLELVRMLSNFETSKEKLMQIILSGQPQLARKLASPELVQLRQRVSIVAHLKPFSSDETARYVNHRLKVAGYSADEPLFTQAALELIAQQSKGIPRNINNLCFNAMSLGCALKKKEIDGDILREVIADLDLDPLASIIASSEKEDIEEAEIVPAKSKRRAWIPRIALTVTALLALSVTPETESSAAAHVNVVRANAIQGTAPASRQDAPATPVLDDEKKTQEVSSAHPPVETEAPTPASDAQASTPPLQNEIVVTPGMTFSQICAAAFTTCHTKESDAIRQLNPWLTNSNKIEVGRVVRIPPHPELSKVAKPSVKPPSSETPKEVLIQ